MNKDNIQITINILKRAQNFNIRSFQDHEGFTAVGTEEELHRCGNTACIAGYIAISPEWHSLGGTADDDGCPIKDGPYKNPTGLMSEFWDVSADVAYAIIYGDYWYLFTKMNNFENLPTAWSQLTKDTAISLFEQMLTRDTLKDPLNA